MRTLKQLLSILILVTCKPSKSSSSTSLMSEENKELVFQPMQGTTVSGTCQWEIWTSKNSRRIPSEITEVYCAGAGMSCERNPMFQVIAIGFFCNFFQKKKEIHLDRYLSIIDQTTFLHLTKVSQRGIFVRSVLLGMSSEWCLALRIHNTDQQCYEFWVLEVIPSSFRVARNVRKSVNGIPRYKKIANSKCWC